MPKRPAKYGIAIALLGLFAALLHTAWPFLFYPVTTLTIALEQSPSYAKTSTAQAGIAERDITPPPGLPKFGYSAWAREADGFRTRLKARAFYLQGPDQAPLAIVQSAFL